MKVFDAAPLEKAKPTTFRYKHRCHVGECPFCFQFFDLREHRCFIQPVDPSDDEPKIRTVAAENIAGREVLGHDPDTGRPFVQEFGTLFIYADYEAITTPTGEQEPIMLCCESADEDETHVFYGVNCTDQFFEHVDDLVIDDDDMPRKIIVIFHNFKGYDGMFILKYLYDNHRDVEDQITVGTKVLSLTNGNIVFKDSLCFLPFPLASFPDTFGIRELRKGFFPHLFNTATNQQYVGPIPAQEYYDPDGMSEKKKAEFLRWYTEQVSNNEQFNLRQEMESYCISDVKLLKAGCQRFQNEFAESADFNPMEKCITIASACNRFWRKKTSSQANNRCRTAQRLVWSTDRAVPKSPNVVRLPKPPSTTAAGCGSTRSQRRPHKTQGQWRGGTSTHTRSTLQCRRIRYRDQNRVRVPRMLLARVPLLPSQPQDVY